MDPPSDKVNRPWQFLPLPPDHLHPLTFLRPDVVLHVHELWRVGRQNEQTTRSFSLRDITQIKPFAMMGLSACLSFIVAWKVTKEDVAILQGIQSLSNLSQGFWDYLLTLQKFSGSIDGMQDGEIMGTVPITATPDVLEKFGDKPVPLDIFRVRGNAGEVALISQAFACILDFAISYSERVLGDKLAKGPPMFYVSEREIHPFWARLAATVEYVVDVQNALNEPFHKLWLWIDDERDEASRERAYLIAEMLRLGGRETMMLVRKEVHGP